MGSGWYSLLGTKPYTHPPIPIQQHKAKEFSFLYATTTTISPHCND